MNIRVLRTSSSIVLRLLGIAFITAAVSNSWQLLNTTDFNNPIHTSRPFLILAVEFKFALGIWLFSGLFKKAAWLSALLYFTVLSLIILYKSITGAKPCTSFGPIPWINLYGIYLLTVITLCVVRPREKKLFIPPKSMLYFIVTFCLWLTIMVITTVVLVQNEPAKLSSSHEALEKIKNIHVSRSLPDEVRPWQENWVSRTHNIILISDKNGFVLWDIENNIKKVKSADSEAVQETVLSPDIVAKTTKSLKGSFGLLPFSSISATPEDSQWKRVDDKDVTATFTNTEVYDLTWSVTKGIVTEYYKWRVFVDRKTELPVRAEWYRKKPREEDYVLRTIEVVTYPSDSEIVAVIQNAFN